MAGIYVHIPFCRKRCSYCDFHFSTTFENYRSQLILAIENELLLRKEEIKEPVETIYFGGGTPSILTEEEMVILFSAIRKYYDVSLGAEITIEVNPEDVNEFNLSFWKKAGINRLSIGLQSFKSEDLKWMNRAHVLEQGVSAIQLAKNIGFENISVDLIYGLPGLSNEEWQQHLERVITLKVQHISAYCLTVEKRTALNHLVKKGTLKPPSEDTQSDQFNLMLRYLSKNGFQQYEISNFSKPHFESKHNTSYWQNKQYLGVGPSAHSYDGKSRRWNVANNTKYYKSVGKNNDWFEIEILSENDQWNELFLTGLRTVWGVSKKYLEQFDTLSSSEQKTLSEHIQNADLIETESAFILTEKGRLKADGIAASLFRV